MTQATRRAKRSCKWCGNDISHMRSNAKFCNTQCKNEYHLHKNRMINASDYHPLKEPSLPLKTEPLKYLYSEPLIKMHEYFAQPGVVFEKFSAAQERFFLEFVDHDIPIHLTAANRGFAKTYLAGCGNLYLLQLNAEQGWKSSILSGSEDQVTKMYRYIKYGLEELHRDLVVSKIKRLNTDLINDGSVKCLLCSETSTRSGRSSIITIDEYCQAKNHVITSVFGQIVTAANIMLRFTGTPDDFESIVHEYWEEADKLGIKKFHATYRDCPHIKVENVNLLKKLYSPDEFLIEMEAVWRARQGNIYPQELVNSAVVDSYNFLKLNKHGFPDLNLNKFDEIVIGVDVGTVHYTVIITVAKKNKIWYVLDCEGFNHKPLNFAKDRVLYYYNKYKQPNVKIEESTITYYMIEELRKQIPIPMSNRIRFPVDKTPYADKVRQLMENGQFKIHKRFKELILQLYQLHFDKTGKIAKINDDYTDALFYALGCDPEYFTNSKHVLTFEDAGYDPGGDQVVFY